MALRLSFSAISDWQRCPRYYYFRWVLQRAAVAAAGRSLAFGRAFHEAQAAWWAGEGDGAVRLIEAIKVWYEHADELTPEDRVLGEVLLIGYAAYWADAALRYQTIPIAERKVETPVLGPDGKPVEGQVAVSVFDVVAYNPEGKTVIIEHKTTRSDVSPGTRYWDRVELSLQADMYHLAALDLGRNVDHVLWDVVRVPDVNRLPATPVHLRETYQKSGPWGKKGDYKRNVRLEPESLDEFQARLTQMVLDNPEAYFGRKPIYRDQAQLDAARADVWGIGQEIEQALATGNFPRNRDSCNKYGVVCQYSPVCNGSADINDERLYTIRKRDVTDPWEE